MLHYYQYKCHLGAGGEEGGQGHIEMKSCVYFCITCACVMYEWDAYFTSAP